jgi:hypothetical protein
MELSEKRKEDLKSLQDKDSLQTIIKQDSLHKEKYREMKHLKYLQMIS